MTRIPGETQDEKGFRDRSKNFCGYEVMEDGKMNFVQSATNVWENQSLCFSFSVYIYIYIYIQPSPGAPPRPTLCIYTLGFLGWLPRWLSGFLGQFQFMPLVPASLFITPSFTLKSVPVWTFHYKITLFMEVGK